MGLRFRKSIKIGNGAKLNINKNLSVLVSVERAHDTVSTAQGGAQSLSVYQAQGCHMYQHRVAESRQAVVLTAVKQVARQRAVAYW